MLFRFALLVPLALVGSTVAGNTQALPDSGRTPVPSNVVAPEYAAKGMPVGAFRLFPALVLGVAHDDNVLRVENGAQSDTYFIISPSLSLETQSEGHFVAIRGGADILEYSELSSDSRVVWYGLAEAGTEIVQGTRIFGSAGYRETFEPRGYFDQALNAAEPTRFSVFHADARIESQPNRFGVAAGVNFDSYNFWNTPLVGGGLLSNTDREFDEYEFYGRLSYEFSPGYAIYAHAAHNTRDYKTALDRNGVNRDSTGYRLNAGLRMEVTRLIVGEVYAGYLNQKYKSPLLTDTGFNFGANLTWSPTPLVDVHIGAAHNIVETVTSQNLLPATDANQEQVTFGIDYAIRRNIVLHGNAGYTHTDFTGTSLSEELTNIGGGISYILNSYISATARYDHYNRDASTNGLDYSANVFWFGLRFQV